MSRIFTLIEEQVNNIVRILLEDQETGELMFGSWLPTPSYIQPLVSAVAIVLFLGLILVFGVYLWNKGLHPAFPGIVAKLDASNPNQSGSPYTQLLITLLAIMTIF